MPSAADAGPSSDRRRPPHPTALELLDVTVALLDDVRVPGRCLLGGKEKLDAKLARACERGTTGEKQPAMSTFEVTRPAVGAQALGIARAAYE